MKNNLLVRFGTLVGQICHSKIYRSEFLLDEKKDYLLTML